MAGTLKFPRLTWDLKEDGAGLKLTVRSDIKPTKVSAWTAASATRDFRKAKWESTAIETNSEEYPYELKRPDAGFAAAFGEAVYTIDGQTLYLSTNVRIIGATEAAGNR